MEVLKEQRDMFGVDFDKNKEALNQISIIRSKMLKNELAGYITKFIKNELRNEESIKLQIVRKRYQMRQHLQRTNQKMSLW